MLGLYALPPFALLALALVLAPIPACALQWWAHRRLLGKGVFVDNDVAGFIVSVVGVLYAVVLGFVTLIVWQQYDTAQGRVALESASVGDAWHDAVGLPPPVREHLRVDMLAYAHSMVDDEWPLMRAGSFSPKGDALIMDATTAVGSMNPATTGQSNAQTALLRLLDDLHDARAGRLASNTAALSSFQWLVLWIGAIVLLAFCALFSTSHIRAHMIMTGCVAVMIATVFVLLFELEAPFRSRLGVSPAPWQGLIRHIGSMESGPMPMRMRM